MNINAVVQRQQRPGGKNRRQEMLLFLFHLSLLTLRRSRKRKKRKLRESGGKKRVQIPFLTRAMGQP